MKILLEARPNFFKSQFSAILFLYFPLFLISFWMMSRIPIGGMIYGVGTAIGLVIHFLFINSQIITITEESIVYKRGIFSISKNEVKHQDVRRVDSSQGLIQRLFSIGNVFIFTTGDMAEIQLRGYEEHEQIKNLISEQRKLYESKSSHSNNSVQNIDIPEQIKKLNSLKEDGLITEEEFENKKKDLLQKM